MSLDMAKIPPNLLILAEIEFKLTGFLDKIHDL